MSRDTTSGKEGPKHRIRQPVHTTVSPYARALLDQFVADLFRKRGTWMKFSSLLDRCIEEGIPKLRREFGLGRHPGPGPKNG